MILRSIIGLAHDLGMDVVAEGAEWKSDAVELEELGCEYVQGFLYGQPMTAEAASTQLEPARRRGWRRFAKAGVRRSGVAGRARQHAEVDADLAERPLYLPSVSAPKTISGSAAQCSQPF